MAGFMKSAVISSSYCLPYSLELTISKNDKFIITDMSGNLLFEVKEKCLTLHDRRVIANAAGTPILTLYKIRSVHSRWEVFRGGSNELVFTAKRSSVLQSKRKLQGFFANTSEEETCDFRVEGLFTVYAGITSSVLAQLTKNTKQSNSTVTVSPNVDHAFIVALVIVDAMDQEEGNSTLENGKRVVEILNEITLALIQ